MNTAIALCFPYKSENSTKCSSAFLCSKLNMSLLS